MEIFLLILMFLFGVTVGALGMYLGLRYLMKKQAEQIQQMMTAADGDPMAMLTGLLEEVKKNA